MNVCCLLAVLTTVDFNDGWRLQRAGEPTETAVPVWCYTNGEEEELFLNCVSQGVRRFADTKDLHLAWDVAYRPGTLEVRAKMKDGRVAVVPVWKYLLCQSNEMCP